jgi:hypothetical protein
VEPLKSIINGYDARLSEKGSVSSKYDLEVPKVRQYLEQALRDESIPIRGTKVDRAAILLKFGWNRIVLARHRGLKDVPALRPRSGTGQGVVSFGDAHRVVAHIR